ncbi:MAG: hypothetical protein AAF573_06815, partial [Bacteroidota bacterium]
TGQEIILPETISITDKFASPWGSNLYYEYELELCDENYFIKRKIQIEDGKKKAKLSFLFL